MSLYVPDRWWVVKITNDSSTQHRVIGSWYGGYLGSDSWRLSSDIVSLSHDLQHSCYTFENASGSTYRCPDHRMGLSPFAMLALDNMIRRTKIYKIELLTEVELKAFLEGAS